MPEQPSLLVQRKATYRMYPNAAELAALERTRVAHCKVTNTLLETSRLRYKAGLPAYNRTSVCEAVKMIRGTHAWIAERTTAQSIQVTGQRVVRAFENFFRRVAQGETPGYPRFKSIKHFAGWGYKTHGDGWGLLQKHQKATGADKVRHAYGAVRLSGIGNVSIRGRARFEGAPKTAEVLFRGGKWFLSVTFNVDPVQVARTGGQATMAFDWGLTTLLTQVVGEPMIGEIKTVDNPRWLKSQLEKIIKVSQRISAMEDLAKKKSGQSAKFPVNGLLRAAYATRSSMHGKIARQRQDFYHQLTAKLVEQYGLIVTEELAVKNMTRAPKSKPDPAAPGQYLLNGAAAKGGLNRSILDAAPAGFIAKLACKAEEAGSRLQFVPTRKVKPTQRCHLCGETTKLTLADRRWTCACGAHHHRDENAPRTMLRYAFEGAWWEPSNQDTGQELARLAVGRLTDSCPETPSKSAC